MECQKVLIIEENLETKDYIEHYSACRLFIGHKTGHLHNRV